MGDVYAEALTVRPDERVVGMPSTVWIYPAGKSASEKAHEGRLVAAGLFRMKRDSEIFDATGKAFVRAFHDRRVNAGWELLDDHAIEATQGFCSSALRTGRYFETLQRIRLARGSNAGTSRTRYFAMPSLLALIPATTHLANS